MEREGRGLGVADTLTLGPCLYSMQIYRGAFLNLHPLSTAQHMSKNNRSDERDLARR